MAQSTLGQWSQRLLTLAGLFCLFYLFLVLIQPYRFPIVLSEKHGRVIDAQTGKGLPGVAVIVTYNLWSSTPMQAGDGGCMHQKIVWTDADGSYVIPNASKDIDVAEDMLLRMVPGYSRNYGWLLEYYKEGYVVKEDLERMIDTIEGRPVPRVTPVEPYTKNGPVYIVPPVAMQKADMASSPAMADAYIASIGSMAAGLRCFMDDKRNPTASVKLRGEMKTSVRKFICDLPPEKILAELALRFSFNDCAASLGMKKILERQGEGAVLTTGVMCEAYDYVPGEYECQSLENRKIPPLQLAPLKQRPPPPYPGIGRT
ncbi:carboxypeptidase-like regulatory domain-containing protein [Dokdonella ginsengisoli]|uniref:Carboxypeptidase-like regulatory domain-containing protein n=1 Tax=Dokdonella ginsengisoli TaxID=363846 RepID=A0ABV9QYD9_9GAMM